MKLENLGLGVLKVLERLGELETENVKLKDSNSNLSKWWQKETAKVKELEEKIASTPKEEEVK